MTTTWHQFVSRPETHAEMFQDPLYETYITSELFVDIYKSLLETLDGRDMTSYFDFFYEPSHVNKSVYVFKDENAKLDFRDFAEDLGLIPKIKHVIVGEDHNDRRAREMNNKQNKACAQKPKPVSSKKEGIVKEINRLNALINSGTDAIELSKLNQKLDKCLKLL